VFGLGWMELLLILMIVLIIFGAGKLPQLGEGVGKAVKGFKKSVFEPEPSQIDSQRPVGSSDTPAAMAPPKPAGERPSDQA
jgi:sec-independent protein translocase protein TatA